MSRMKTTQWILAAFVVMLNGCNPYDGLQPNVTSTAVTTVTPASARLINSSTLTLTPPPSCTVTTGVPSGYLNIRTGAGMQYAVIDVLHEGEQLQVLARTDLDYILIDMKTPGITVKPIIMADGGHEVNEVFFDNVKVPVANLVGKENEGWTCAKFLLANERLGIAEVPSSKRGVRSLRELNDDPSFNEKIADVDLQVQALEMSELRALSTMALGGAPGPEVSTLKVRGSEIQQRITELTMEAVGEYAAPYLPGLLWQGSNEEPVGPAYAHQAAPRYFNTRKTTIYGGSNKIQKGIISKMVLGL